MGASKKYRAFISYAHADEAWGGWLQRKLERFRAPGALARELEAKGAPQRLAPVFRDREDLPAGDDLNAAIQQALADSEYQIVLCSPRSVNSRWVNEEAKLFYKLHGPGRTLALIIDGEPGASSIPGREEEECLPEALRFRLDENGNVTDERAEPLAADARDHGDGKDNAFLKVAAGMLGVGLDDLIRRDAQRRMRIWRAIGGGALLGVIVLAGLAGFAYEQRGVAVHQKQIAVEQKHIADSEKLKAVKQQHEAEGLIDFMLTGLRDKLEPIGKLDVLDDVAGKALDYYKAQDLSALDGDSLNRRARALMFSGTVLQRRGELGKALKAFEEANKTTAEQLRREPNNPDRIFDHAQSVFYVADIALSRGNLAAGERGYQEYFDLAQRLVEIDPDNPRSRLELAYATSNLGAAKFRSGKFDEAALYFEKSTEIRRELRKEKPEDQKAALAYAYSISWLAYNDLWRSQFRRTIDEIQEQIRIYDPILKNDADNFTILDPLATAYRRLGEAHMSIGETTPAARYLSKAQNIAEKLLRREKRENTSLSSSVLIEFDRSQLFALEGDLAAAAKAADHAVIFAHELPIGAGADMEMRSNYVRALAQRIAIADGSPARKRAAQELGPLMETMLAQPQRYRYVAIGEACLELGRYKHNQNDADAGQSLMMRCGDILTEREDTLGVSTKATLFALYLEAGDLEKARRLSVELDKLGYRRADYLKLKERLQSSREQ